MTKLELEDKQEPRKLRHGCWRARIAELVGGSIISLLWLVVFGVIAVVAYEYALPSASTAMHPLTRVGYYKTTRTGNPYKPFHKQHLHPNYLFFFPLDADQRLALGNEIVSITKNGFRGDDPTIGKTLAVVLGGSAAFGDLASSDQTTITGYLNRFQSTFHFVNAGVPSWNSTQELHRLADQIVPLNPKLVVSYSLSNDVIIALRMAKKDHTYPAGSPEGFEDICRLIECRQGTVKLRLLEYSLEKFFPRTRKLVSKLVNRRDRPVPDDKLLAAVDGAVDKYIWNQTIMHAIADGRGFRFLTIIQPTLRSHKNFRGNDRTSKGDWWLFEHAVRRVMSSEYCRLNCLDYSDLFDKDFADIPVFKNVKETPDHASLIFGDEVHLLDAGNEYVARRLMQDLQLEAVAPPR